MAFSYTVRDSGTGGPNGLKMSWGTFTNTAGSTGGGIETGFAFVQNAILNITSHFNSAEPKLTFTTSDGTLTIVTEADADGTWMAWGRGEG